MLHKDKYSSLKDRFIRREQHAVLRPLQLRYVQRLDGIRHLDGLSNLRRIRELGWVVNNC
jgi:hypothetical protein